MASTRPARRADPDQFRGGSGPVDEHGHRLSHDSNRSSPPHRAALAAALPAFGLDDLRVDQYELRARILLEAGIDHSDSLGDADLRRCQAHQGSFLFVLLILILSWLCGYLSVMSSKIVNEISAAINANFTAGIGKMLNC